MGIYLYAGRELGSWMKNIFGDEKEG